jgi:hypothetical protein
MDDMNVLKLVTRIDFGVLRASDVRHIAPVVCRCVSQQNWFKNISHTVHAILQHPFLPDGSHHGVFDGDRVTKE